MSAIWQWRRPATVTHKPTRDTTTYAPHIRGRVTTDGRMWRISVVNTLTGETIASDNGCVGLDRAFEEAEFVTAAARASWMFGFGQKRVSASRKRVAA